MERLALKDLSLLLKKLYFQVSLLLFRKESYKCSKWLKVRSPDKERTFESEK